MKAEAYLRKEVCNLLVKAGAADFFSFEREMLMS